MEEDGVIPSFFVYYILKTGQRGENMNSILEWLSSTTGIITTISAFMVAILLFIENSKKLIFKPLSKIFNFLFGWLHKKDREEAVALRKSVIEFMDQSNAQDEKIIGIIDNLDGKVMDIAEHVDGLDSQMKDLDNQIKDLDGQVKDNEKDRIRQEIFHYGYIARMKAPITTEEWRHIQEIYKKYHDVLKANGMVTEEYEYIKEYYYAQFKDGQK